jgi:fumarate reductase subunit C
MSERPSYTLYHPRWYRQRPSTYWWLRRPAYLLFILREISSVFVAWFVVYLLFLVHAVSRGQHAYERFQHWSAHPLVVTLNVVALAFVVLHAVTWFNLSAQAVVVRMRGQRVPGHWITASNYAAWVVVSALAAWLVLGG